MSMSARSFSSTPTASASNSRRGPRSSTKATSRTIRCRPTARNAKASSPRGRRCPPNRYSQGYHWELLLDLAFWPGSFLGVADFDRNTPSPPRRRGPPWVYAGAAERSEEHTSELQSLMRISYAVFCLKKKTMKLKRSKIQSTTNDLQIEIKIPHRNYSEYTK